MNIFETIWKFISGMFGVAIERPSPSDILPWEALTYYEVGNKVEINLWRLPFSMTEQPNVRFCALANTGSMDPVMDAEHNSILIAGKKPADHQLLVDWLFAQEPGNIAVYETLNLRAIHRVVSKGIDKDGEYLRFKGDNNPVMDSSKVRKQHIEWVSIGVIY